MIPSDHFVRFYNEVFKYLDERGGLEGYYKAISHKQERHCLELFKSKGLQGVYEYYLRIYKEENCQGRLELKEHELVIAMECCPSLSKVLNNDATPSPKYCLHCPGWTTPVYQKAGLFQIFDLMELDKPHCCEWILDDLDAAKARYRAVVAAIRQDHSTPFSTAPRLLVSNERIRQP